MPKPVTPELRSRRPRHRSAYQVASHPSRLAVWCRRPIYIPSYGPRFPWQVRDNSTLSARQCDIVDFTRHTQSSFVHPSTIQQSTIPVYLCPEDVTHLTDHARSTSSLDLWVSFAYFVSCPLSRANGPPFLFHFSLLFLTGSLYC